MSKLNGNTDRWNWVLQIPLALATTMLMVKFIHNKRYLDIRILLRKVLKNKDPSFYYCGLKDWPIVFKCWFDVKDFHQQIKSKCDKDKWKTIRPLLNLQIPRHWTSVNLQFLPSYFMTSGNIYIFLILLILCSTYWAC